MDLLTQTYFADILHIVAQALLVPTVIALIALIIYALWCIGSIIVEYVREHRHFQVAMPQFEEAMVRASEEELPQVILDANLLGHQKISLLTLWDYRCLPVDAHVALAKRLLNEQDAEHTRVLSRTQTVSKIAPMLGLMGTLIPLGPGLVSLGVGDTLTLSSSLLVAFDTTVAGLVVALVTYIITKIRSRWYEDYMSALEAGTTALLEKVDNSREAGTLQVTQPTNYAIACGLKGAKKQGKRTEKKGRHVSPADSTKAAQGFADESPAGYTPDFATRKIPTQEGGAQ